jgi:hypothetical protein
MQSTRGFPAGFGLVILGRLLGADMAQAVAA